MVEKRLEESRVALQHLEMALINTACDDAGEGCMQQARNCWKGGGKGGGGGGRERFTGQGTTLESTPATWAGLDALWPTCSAPSTCPGQLKALLRINHE